MSDENDDYSSIFDGEKYISVHTKKGRKLLKQYVKAYKKGKNGGRKHKNQEDDLQSQMSQLTATDFSQISNLSPSLAKNVSKCLDEFESTHGENHYKLKPNDEEEQVENEQVEEDQVED